MTQDELHVELQRLARSVGADAPHVQAICARHMRDQKRPRTRPPLSRARMAVACLSLGIVLGAAISVIYTYP